MNFSGPCQVVNCQSEAICRALNTRGELNFTCDCHPAYTSQFCETLFDPCALNLCLNNAACENIGLQTTRPTVEKCEIEL